MGRGADGQNFPGSDDYFLRNSDLTGMADSKVGTVSIWVKMGAGSDGNLSRILSNNTLRFLYR